MWKSLLLQQMGGEKGSPSVPRRQEEGIDFVGVPNLRGNLEGRVEGEKGKKMYEGLAFVDQRRTSSENFRYKSFS